MKTFRLLLVLFVGGFAWSVFQKTRVKKSSVDSQVGARGFVTGAATPNTPAGKVVIVAPIGCPQEAGRRADALERVLSQARLPVVRRNEVSFVAGSEAEAAKLDGLMRGEVPIVFVGRRAMNNPTAEEVSVEFALGRTK